MTAKYCLQGSDAVYFGRSLPASRRKYCPHLQDRRINPESNKHSKHFSDCCLLPWLTGLLVDPEDEGSTLLRNGLDSARLQPRHFPEDSTVNFQWDLSEWRISTSTGLSKIWATFYDRETFLQVTNPWNRYSLEELTFRWADIFLFRETGRFSNLFTKASAGLCVDCDHHAADSLLIQLRFLFHYTRFSS
jgi:hypothetical protein